MESFMAAIAHLMVPEAESSPDKPVGYGAPPVLLCEYRDESGEACTARVFVKRPGCRYCRHHYDRLRRAGLILARPEPNAEKPEATSTVSTARARFLQNADFYSDQHKIATKNASKKGDARPAEWAMSHARVVEPLEKGDSGPRISVQVGIALPGLGMSAQASESKALPAITVTMGEAQPQLEAESASANTPKS